MKTLKAVRYLRVSSEHQVEGTSLRTQYDVTTKKGKTEFIVTFEDAGHSAGLLLNAPAPLFISTKSLKSEFQNIFHCSLRPPVFLL